jgi:hypothetical protein
MSLTISWNLGRSRPVTHARVKHRRDKPLPLPIGAERRLHRVDSATGISVATNESLFHGDGTAAWHRIPWSDVASVNWSRGADSLTLRLWPRGSGARRGVRVVADARLADVARERTAAHRLLCVSVDVNGIPGRVIAVRDGADVRWQVVLDKPTDDPATRRACADAIAEIRGIAGL